MDSESIYPTYEFVEARPEGVKVSIHVLNKEESEKVPEFHRETFNKDGKVEKHKLSCVLAGKL